MIFCMDHIWRDAWLKAVTTMIPVILFTGIAVAPLYLLVEMNLNEIRRDTPTSL